MNARFVPHEHQEDTEQSSMVIKYNDHNDG